MEVDDGSDLNILASHVAKVLLEEVIGFKVSLVTRADSDKAMERLAKDRQFPDSVDVNMGVMAEAKANVGAYFFRAIFRSCQSCCWSSQASSWRGRYNKFVAQDNLLIDLGPTGYSVQAGWFTQDRVSLSSLGPARMTSD